MLATIFGENKQGMCFRSRRDVEGEESASEMRRRKTTIERSRRK